ncbi:hypothetical protein [Noviherbaspirillum sp. Root189]|uniref:hypothetical protein n=1 Tax=Noviherbaspirillum sp. Root189 TaxID=1736487 RepID=UPI00070B59EC|nr:hypothetical protein [Noviherbaspirillum sp. Root189]KRB72344.1 hypothetical protein ASE07_27180 [Noviherbaspirillum sp. Root189]
MQPLNENTPSIFDSSLWWVDDDGTWWPLCLTNLVNSKRLRMRSRERASAITDPQLIAHTLHCAHLKTPILTLADLKQILDEMEQGGCDFTEAIDLQAMFIRQEHPPLSPTDVVTAAVAPLARVYRFPARGVGPSRPIRTTHSVSYERVQRSLVQAEVNLQKEIEQGRVPNNVDACRMIIRQTLGIRRRIQDKDVEE